MPNLLKLSKFTFLKLHFDKFINILLPRGSRFRNPYVAIRLDTLFYIINTKYRHQIILS